MKDLENNILNKFTSKLETSLKSFKESWENSKSHDQVFKYPEQVWKIPKESLASLEEL